MSQITNSKRQYDLEERTFKFAKQIRQFVKALPKTTGNIEDSKQVIRSSGSVGANYIEANEASTKKDFKYRIRVSKKEAKESRYWLCLIDTGGSTKSQNEQQELIKETTELMNIFGSILEKSN